MNVQRFLVLFIILIGQCTQAQFLLNKDSIITSIEERIKLPIIPDYVVNVSQFGAKGNGIKNCKPAFDRAMKACEKVNGGTIIVPKGVYRLEGPIHFVSNTRLHLQAGAKLVFGSNPKDYPLVLTSWEGTNLYNYSPMIYGVNVSNVAITGEGIIDGEGNGLWATWKPIQSKGQQLSREMNHNKVAIKDRVFGEGHYLRPQLIQFVNSKNILIQDVKIEDAPFWCVHILNSSGVVLKGLKYDAHNKNNDGIDIENSNDILIEDIDFNNGDDNVAIKAGRDHDGRANMNHPSKNIIIRNCRFKGLHALVIGSEMSGGVKNVFAYDCIASGYLKRGIYFKTNSNRGGYIKNILVDNIRFGDVEDAIYMTSNYHGEGNGLFPSKISNITLSNISFDNVSNTAIVIEGYPKFKVKNVTLDHITFKSAKNGMTLSNTENIKFNEIVIGEKQGVPSSVK
ncbi:glycoside hydrolase family 28 protein [Thalassobellus suaedae]|uniref:Glycoside hydrolase family 28 protein n=1 Tax=Thalassobellus suaedae TaxID=3074124 RepID=A0ABY9Y367_9FLAO|nr:glycoside hydrolase family 28 protein [Flavobacteriaceae bacterium HL-DH10]